MPKFLLKFHAAVIKEIIIDKTPLTIGRKSDNDIVIDNLAVSGKHARLTLQGNSYVLEDLQSTNGTFVNDKRVISSVLKHEDNVAIGQHTLVFIHPEAQQPAQPKPQPQAKELNTEATIVMTPQAAHQSTSQSQGQAETPPCPSTQKSEKMGYLRVIEGKIDQSEYELSGLLTYIGKSETAAIKVKGMFAPDIAALISKRPNGYLITAVKDGYPKVNNNSLSGQIEMNDGDIIEIGGIKFLFQLKELK